MSWIKSSFCSSATCVEVRIDEEVVYVKHSGATGSIAFTADEWDAFLAGARAGEFDRSS